MNDQGFPESDDLDHLRHLDGKNVSDDFYVILSLLDSTGCGSGSITEGVDELTGRPVLVLKLHTGGWLECERMITVLQENVFFWTMYWYSTTRGGHYEFRGRRNMERERQEVTKSLF